MPSNFESSLKYRADIDGLRAVAIATVLAFHAFPASFPGGFIGVDIFFVISGYLITGIIYENVQKRRFSIGNFYTRRMRRIFPALIIVVSATFAIGWAIMPPRDFESLGTNIAGGIFFAQNLVLLGQVGYFDLAAEKKPLLHLWSLGIEEQFYIFWPLLLLLIRRFNINVLAMVAALTVTSFVLCMMAPTQEQAFYLPSTRAWELFAGAALAVWHRNRESSNQSTRIVSEASAACALLAIVVALRTFDSSIRYPSYHALVPVVAALLLLGLEDTFVQRFFLSSRPAVFVGLISYPLYLWHFPLLAYAHLRYTDGVLWQIRLGILLVSIVLAWITYRFVERPLRFGKTFPRYTIGGLIGAMVALGLIGFATVGTGGFPSRTPDSIRPFMLDGSDSAHWRRGECLLLPEQSAADFKPECSGDGQRPLILIWGDSYAAAFYPGLNYFSSKRGFSVAEFTASACPPLVGFVSRYRESCKGANDFVVKQIEALRPEVVILHSTWRDLESDIAPGLRRTVDALRAMNVKKIVLLGPVATWLGDGLPSNILNFYYQHGTVLPERTWYRSNDAWTRPAEAFLESQVRQLDIEYISARKVLCNESGCLARIGPNGSQLTSFDTGHLTRPGAVFLADAILERLLSTGK